MRDDRTIPINNGRFTITIDNEEMGSAETLIGNALVQHKPTRWSSFTAWVHRKRSGTGGRLVCGACGDVVGPGWGFWYHQAQAAIQTLRKNQEYLQ